MLKTPLPGGGKPNPACARCHAEGGIADRPKTRSRSAASSRSDSSARSISAISLWNKEYELMCPNNPIGTVDAVLRHASRPRRSRTRRRSSTACSRAWRSCRTARARGPAPQAMPTMRTSPGLEDIWQLHWAYSCRDRAEQRRRVHRERRRRATIAGVLTAPPRGGGPGGAARRRRWRSGRRGAAGPPTRAASGNRPGRVAPPPAAARRRRPGALRRRPAGRRQPARWPPGGARTGPGDAGAARRRAHTPAYWIKLSAQQDGTFTVTNSRNGFSKTYRKR